MTSKNYKVFIIDDSIETIKLMVSVFEKYAPNYEIYQTNNSEKATEIAEQINPDLIITDWNMPKISGIDIINQFKANSALKNIPIIMATGAMLTNTDLQTALIAGAVDYIRKPIDATELIARTNSALTLADYYNQIVSQKDNELAESSLHLIKSQEFNRLLASKIENVKGLIKKKPSLGISELDKLKEDLLLQVEEEGWYRFSLSFSQVHTDFNKNLTSKHHDITPAELKLCAFIRLGMANKEIAAVLNQTPDSIKTSRYRLRKKLNLDGLNLETYIAGF